MEELFLIRENLNLIGCWSGLVRRVVYKEVVEGPYTLIIKQLQPGEYETDWMHVSFNDDNSHVFIDKDLILNPLKGIIDEIRFEIHGTPLESKYDAQHFADRATLNPCAEIVLPKDLSSKPIKLC